jgi:membrane-bound lytic murein transglycosylase D
MSDAPLLAKPKRALLDRVLLATALITGASALIVSAIPEIHSYVQGERDPMTNAVNEALVLSKAATAEVIKSEDKLISEAAAKNPWVAPGEAIAPQFDRDDVLSDPERRISENFLIPPGLQDRVGFWFDIYSRYDSNKRIIHHSLYPWVIFKVVDVEPIISATYPRFRWMRNQVADELVKKEAAKVRVALESLSKKRRPRDLENDRLKPDEILVRDALLQLGGDLRRTAKRARPEVRVQMGQRNFMAEGIQIAPRYMTTMEEIFKKQKLPIELTRLPLVESSFKSHAHSKVGAMGVWQFMESTGRSHKLIVNDIIDERKSIYKSTAAAAVLLKENHMILHRSWALALTAWNHGPSGVRKAYRAAGTKDIARIIELYHSKSFNFASENFFPSFLAALYTERYSERIFPGLPKLAPVVVQELRLSRKIKAEDVARVAAITIEEFVSINPDLAKVIKMRRPLQKGLRIHVPSETHSAVEYFMASGKPVKPPGKRLIGAND